MTTQVGHRLEQALQTARREVVLAAPFIKLAVAERLIRVLDRSVRLVVITRWRPEEVAAGVTDLEVMDLLTERPLSSLFLCDRLHAKYYRSDRRVLVGSANLTGAALGWAPIGNLELLLEVTEVLEDPIAIEKGWLEESVVATDEIRDYVREAAQALHRRDIVPTVDTNHEPSVDANSEPGGSTSAISWLPSLRHPDSLYSVYAGKNDCMSTDALRMGLADLVSLQLPAGLSQEQLHVCVRARLLQVPLIARIDKLVETPRRFGEIRDLIARHVGSTAVRRDPDEAWQTTLRWLLHFAPERYRLSRPRHSEVLERIAPTRRDPH